MVSSISVKLHSEKKLLSLKKLFFEKFVEEAFLGSFTVFLEVKCDWQIISRIFFGIHHFYILGHSIQQKDNYKLLQQTETCVGDTH